LQNLIDVTINLLYRVGMKLKEWMLKGGHTPASLGIRLGVHPASVYRYIKGQRPNIRVAQKIIKVSGGKVNLNDLLK